MSKTYDIEIQKIEVSWESTGAVATSQGKSAMGISLNEAIGTLIAKNPEMFGIQIIKGGKNG